MYAWEEGFRCYPLRDAFDRFVIPFLGYADKIYIRIQNTRFFAKFEINSFLVIMRVIITIVYHSIHGKLCFKNINLLIIMANNQPQFSLDKTKSKFYKK